VLLQLLKLKTELESIIEEANIVRAMPFLEQLRDEHPEFMDIVEAFIFLPASEVAKKLRGYRIPVDAKGEKFIARWQAELKKKRFKR
jgi:hypothetical protein